MSQIRTVQRILLGLGLGSFGAMEAFARTTGQEKETMSFVSWIVLGLLSGFIGSKIVNRRGEGILLDVLLGIVGAITGGWVFRVFGEPGVTGLNLYSLLVAVVGSVLSWLSTTRYLR